MKLVNLILLFALTFSYQSYAAVTVDFGEQQKSFADETRLASVLDEYLNKPVYWPVSQLYSSAYLETERANIQQLISTLITKGSLAKKTTYLSTYIGSWTLGKKISIAPNIAAIRLKEELNPSFVGKHYHLVLSERPKQISIFGATDGVISLGYNNQARVTEYLAQINRPSSANKDFVYLIQPNLQIVKVGVSYWNKSNITPMPGSLIFIPFEEPLLNLDNQLGKLNNSILKLANHLILK